MEHQEPLPPLYQSELAPEAYALLIDEIEAVAEDLEVTVKGGATRFVEADVRPSLRAASQELVQGTVRAVQLRYRHQGKRWTDTLLRTASGFRIVRIEDVF